MGDRYADAPAAERTQALGELGLKKMIEGQKETLARLGVEFDEWRSEREVLASGALEDALQRLEENGHVYEADGALWLSAKALGDETDRPLRRSNGEPTYLAGDLAYHLDKFRRGFERVIDIWGPDHLTYVRRTQAGIEALGYRPDSVDIQVLEPVTLKLDGQLLEAGASGGNNILLDEVIEDVGKDTARFSYLLRGPQSPLEFDLDLARQQPEAVPAQKVRATLASVRSVLDGARCRGQLPALDPDTTLAAEAGDQRLLRRLADFPDEVRAAARELDPSRITRYAVELAGLAAPVASQAPEPARLALLDAAEVVLTNALQILGIATD